MRLEGEAWSRYFRDFQRSAFRLELRQVYTMPGEADELRRFRAGEKPPADYHYGWLDTMAAARAAGKTVRRVRVVRRPLTDYIRYEFEWGFVYNVAAGEDIRVADLTEYPGLAHLKRDFWLFDSETVLLQYYDQEGRFQDSELRSDVAAYCCRARDAALNASIPLTEYLTALGT